jgi:hypothetical protein
LASHPLVHGSGENSYLEELASADMLALANASAPGGRIGFPESLAQFSCNDLSVAGE